MEGYTSEFWLIFIAGTMGMVLLAAFIIFFVIFYQKRMLQHKIQQQELASEYQIKMLQATLESQEKERRRIAAELHDSIGGMLSVIRVNVLTKLTKGVDKESINTIKEIIDESINSLRKIGRDLMPLSLERWGLVSALREICDQYAAASAININITEEGESKSLSDKQSIALFRVLQELLNNAIKHAETKRIDIHFKWTFDSLEIKINDNGKGYDFEHFKENSNGLGLFNIENRLKSIDASYTIINKGILGMETTILIGL